jgi:hypothetical protein
METAGIGGVRQPPLRQSAVLKHSPLARVTGAAKSRSDAVPVSLNLVLFNTTKQKQVVARFTYFLGRGQA